MLFLLFLYGTNLTLIDLILLVISVGIVLFFGMGWHEYAHAVVADWWGDPTPRQYGRLTPNPVVHIDWAGWLMFLVIGFGRLGSVPINPRAMRDSRWGSFWTSFAGPLSNLAQATIFGIVFSLFVNLAPSIIFGTSLFGRFIYFLLISGVQFNVLLFVFNLLPFFPLDGWRMVLSILPGNGLKWTSIPAGIRQNIPALASFVSSPAYKWQDWAQYSQYVLLFLVIISFAIPSFSPLHWMIAAPTARISGLLLTGFGF